MPSSSSQSLSDDSIAAEHSDMPSINSFSGPHPSTYRRTGSRRKGGGVLAADEEQVDDEVSSAEEKEQMYAEIPPAGEEQLEGGAPPFCAKLYSRMDEDDLPTLRRKMGIPTTGNSGHPRLTNVPTSRRLDIFAFMRLS